MLAHSVEKHSGSKTTQYQGRCMKNRTRYSSGLLTDFDYLSAPDKPDAIVLADQVRRYREGDLTQRRPIIEAHLHIVASIAGDYRDSDEMLGVALLALVDAVQRAPSILDDNEITPYITSTVNYRIKDAVARNRSVYMPPSTFRDKVANGEIDRETNDNPIVIGVVSLTAVVLEDEENADGDDFESEETSYWRGAYTVPTAKPETASIEFREALSLAIHTKTEEDIVTMKANGYGYKAMEGILKMKKTQIGYHLDKVRDRFDRLYA